MHISVNKLTLPIVEGIVSSMVELRIGVKKGDEGGTIIDAGIDVPGGYLAGKHIVDVCLGGLGSTQLFMADYGGIMLPTISVYTDQPAISLLGSQFAGWRIVTGKYSAMCSGPGRALAQKPRSLYAKIGYRDDSEVAILVLETDTKPPRDVLRLIMEECKVSPEGLYVIVCPTTSLAGTTQIAGRILEVGLHRLAEIGLNPLSVLSGCGVAPIAPVHPKLDQTMGRTNDMILYGGAVYFNVDAEDEELKRIVEEAPSSASPDYGRPFIEVFKNAEYNFYRIDPKLFAPASVTVNNVKTGRIFTAGKPNFNALHTSIHSG